VWHDLHACQHRTSLISGGPCSKHLQEDHAARHRPCLAARSLTARDEHKSRGHGQAVRDLDRWTGFGSVMATLVCLQNQRSLMPCMIEIKAGEYNGTYVHYGVREHGMAAAMNGIALHGGLIPYGGTFLCFSDYCRPSIPLAALMQIRTIFVMTHDSIGLSNPSAGRAARWPARHPAPRGVSPGRSGRDRRVLGADSRRAALGRPHRPLPPADAAAPPRARQREQVGQRRLRFSGGRRRRRRHRGCE
jgi:Transketolase, pyrimidine binding domain